MDEILNIEEQKAPTAKETLEALNKAIEEATGSEMFSKGSTYDAALVMIAIAISGSVKDVALRESTGISRNKIRAIKSRMRENKLLFSKQGTRKPTIDFAFFQDIDENNGLEQLLSFVADVMVAAGELTRRSSDETINP